MAGHVAHVKSSKVHLMAVFSVTSGPSGSSAAKISSSVCGSSGTTLGLLPLSLSPIPAVMAFHKAFWDLEPRQDREGTCSHGLNLNVTVYNEGSFLFIYLFFTFPHVRLSHQCLIKDTFNSLSLATYKRFQT